jgi:hypothetical protein
MAYLRCLGWEELEGEGWLPLLLRLGEFLGDVHGDRLWDGYKQKKKEKETPCQFFTRLAKVQ